MQLARWYNNRDIRLEEVPVPAITAAEMLVEVMACGICGSDIAEWYRLPRAPLVPGHELGGRVVAVGGEVTGFAVGDRVCIVPKVPCMVCTYCQAGHHPVCTGVAARLPGGFAQFIAVPAALVERGTYRLPSTMTYLQSTFIEPLACVIRAQRLAGLKAGQRLLVMGAGMSGLLHVKLAVWRGCRIWATDLNRQRLDMAEKCGAEQAITPGEDIVSVLGDQGVDVVMLCTSSLSAIDEAWRCLDKGGTLVFFAVPEPDRQVILPINPLWMKEVTVRTSYYCGPDDIASAVDLLAGGAIEVDSLVSHLLPLSDIGEGFQLVAAADTSLKVIITPNGPAEA